MEPEPSPQSPTIPTFGSLQAIDQLRVELYSLPKHLDLTSSKDHQDKCDETVYIFNPMPDDATVDHTHRPGRDPIMTRTRPGTAIHPPN